MLKRFTIEFVIDGQKRKVVFHQRHWLPRLLRVGGVALGTKHILLKDIAYNAPHNTSKEMMYGPITHPYVGAHEVLHLVDRRRRGFVRWWSGVLWELLTIRTHDKRSYEIFAEDGAALLLRGTFPGQDGQEIRWLFLPPNMSAEEAIFDYHFRQLHHPTP